MICKWHNVATVYRPRRPIVLSCALVRVCTLFILVSSCFSVICVTGMTQYILFWIFTKCPSGKSSACAALDMASQSSHRGSSTCPASCCLCRVCTPHTCICCRYQRCRSLHIRKGAQGQHRNDMQSCAEQHHACLPKTSQCCPVLILLLMEGQQTCSGAGAKGTPLNELN